MPSFGDVRLRAFDERDVPMLMDLSTDPYVPKIGTLPANASHEEALTYIGRQADRLETGAGYPFCVAGRETVLYAAIRPATGSASARR